MRRSDPIRWLREHERGADLLLAASVTVLVIFVHIVDETHTTDPNYIAATWWSVLIAAMTALPIYWRRSWPMRSGVVVVAVQCIALVIGILGAAFVGSTIAVYSIGAHANGPSRTRVLVAIGSMIAGLFVVGWIDGQNLIGEFISTTVLLVTAGVLGDNMRRRRERADSLAERAERAEREQELLAQQRVYAERTRIARELHDVVAHSVSVMVIQAAAARRNLTVAPDRSEQALTAIEETGRQTMNELRGMLGVLRNTDEEPDRAPQPSLADLDALLGRDDDLPIDLVVGDDIGELPHSVMLTGYRVIQEAMTNIRRHAGPVERVEVRVVRHLDQLVISIDDDGRGAAADRTDQGFGLVGMRERVAAAGGVVEAGPRSGGGWVVRTSLPIDAHSPVSSEAVSGEAVSSETVSSETVLSEAVSSEAVSGETVS